MSIPLKHRGRGIVGLSHAGTTSSGGGTEFELDTPLGDWSLQVVSGSCNLKVLLEGTLGSSSDASFATLATWESSSAGGGEASGDMVFATDKPAWRIRASVDANSSSAGSSAWIAGV